MLLLKNLLFVVLVPGTVGVLLPWRLAGGPPPVGGLHAVGAVALWAAGGALLLACVWQFAVHGRGTPAPIDAPKHLVVRGPYRFVRNPMYLAVLAAILGWSAWYGDPRLLVYAFAVAVGFHLFVLFYEEPHLGSLFGDEYDAYRAAVRRWLPRRRGWPQRSS